MPYLASIHKLQDPEGWNKPAGPGVSRRLTHEETLQSVREAYHAYVWANVAIDLLEKRD